MKKIKNLTYEEHLENADDFAIAFHHLEKIFKRCEKVYPKTHKIMQKIMMLNELQILFSSECCKIATREQIDKDEFIYLNLRSRYEKIMNK